LSSCSPLLLPSFPLFHPSEGTAFVSAIMAPQLNAAQHILINTLLKEGFETKLIASETSCSAHAVQRIRLKRQQSEMPTSRTKRGRRSCVTSPMKKAFFDTLTEQPYLYRCEMADFFYRRFRRKISERSVGRILRSIGWTRTTIHCIAQQRDADLRDHYLHRISQYKSYQLVFVDESGCDGRAGYRR
jgi:transposase